jgi:phosphatidylserine decarboxylase
MKIRKVYFFLTMEVSILLKPLYRFFIELTNGRWSSFILKKFSRSKLSKPFVSSFANAYKINTDEMEQNLHEFSSLHDFFIRKLKNEARPINQEDTAILSPVDAVIEDIGKIHPNAIINVKGKQYSISEMLGSFQKAEKYLEGTYMILYLSPSHYHRIHSPVSGTITDQWELGSKSYPVNKMGLKYGRDTLSKNYRYITEIDVLGKQIALIKVGAMFVNSIELTHPNEHLSKGSEMAYFTFGSTVILLFPNNHVTIAGFIQTPYHIKMGEKIGEIHS